MERDTSSGELRGRSGELAGGSGRSYLNGVYSLFSPLLGRRIDATACLSPCGSPRGSYDGSALPFSMACGVEAPCLAGANRGGAGVTTDSVHCPSCERRESAAYRESRAAQCSACLINLCWATGAAIMIALIARLSLQPQSFGAAARVISFCLGIVYVFFVIIALRPPTGRLVNLFSSGSGKNSDVQLNGATSTSNLLTSRTSMMRLNGAMTSAGSPPSQSGSPISRLQRGVSNSSCSSVNGYAPYAGHTSARGSGSPQNGPYKLYSFSSTSSVSSNNSMLPINESVQLLTIDVDED